MLTLSNILFDYPFEKDYLAFGLDAQERIDQILVEIMQESIFPPPWVMLSKQVIGFYGIVVPFTPNDIGLLARLEESSLVIMRAIDFGKDGDFTQQNPEMFLT
ncbi:MAG: hypothetical protein AAF696_25050 [Bacteroidota bacterium]